VVTIQSREVDVDAVHISGHRWLDRSRGGSVVHGRRGGGGEKEAGAVHCCGGEDGRCTLTDLLVEEKRKEVKERKEKREGEGGRRPHRITYEVRLNFGSSVNSFFQVSSQFPVELVKA
jgi:hypothetical protein